MGLEFLTLAGFVALVDNENADDWMGRVSSLETSMLELSSPKTKICRHAQEVWIETTRRFIQVSWTLGPFKSNDCDPWNGTTWKTYFLFLTVWNRTQRMENTSKILESSASRRWEKLCFWGGCCVLFRPQKETLFLPSAIFFVPFSVFHRFLSMFLWIEPGVSPDWTLSKNARHE